MLPIRQGSHTDNRSGLSIPAYACSTATPNALANPRDLLGRKWMHWTVGAVQSYKEPRNQYLSDVYIA